MPSEAPKQNRLLAVLFAVYLVLLTWGVLWKLTVPWVGEAAFLAHPIKLIPFLPSGDAGASDPLEIVANVLVFVPFGLYLALLAPRWRWFHSAAVFAGASLVLELAQHVFSTGSFDVSDVIANTAGGLVGLWLLKVVRLQPATMTRVLLIATVVALVAIALYIASPWHYVPIEDVVVRAKS